MASSVVFLSPVYFVKPQIDSVGKSRCSFSPLVEFIFFHKAIRAELGRLHQDALAVEQGSQAEIMALVDRYHFLRAIYKHHCRAEDEVLFPALDLRVKNVALAYTLEHQDESELFEQLLVLLTTASEDGGNIPMELRLELICCTEAIQTTVCQHFSKEEEQVFPLLMAHFSLEEQADLVWQFLCSIPVNLMEKFLPWLATSLTQVERQQMVVSLKEIVPEEELLQEIVLAWVQGGNNQILDKGVRNVSLPFSAKDGSLDCEQLNTAVIREENLFSVTTRMPENSKGLEKSAVINQKNPLSVTTRIPEDFNALEQRAVIIDENPLSSTTRILEDSKDSEKSARKLCEPDIGRDLTAKGNLGRFSPSPINELLHWHNAIRKELREFAEETRQMRVSGTLPNLPSFLERLQFLADVCIFHSTAEDKVIFPAVNEKIQRTVYCALDHAREEQHIDELLRLVRGLQAVETGSTVPFQLCVNLCAQVEVTLKSIGKHLRDEELEILPLARKHFSAEEQRVLLYQSLRVMPLKLLERVLPWLVGVLDEDEAKDMFRNMQLAAPVADNALVTLFTGWACKGQPRNSGISGASRCISPKECPLKSKIKEDYGGTVTSSKLGLEDSPDRIQKRPVKRPRDCSETQGAVTARSSKDRPETNERPNPGSACCVPGLGCNGVRAKSQKSSIGPISMGPSSTSISGTLGYGLSSWESSSGGVGNYTSPKPIDHIFQFHKAIRKDLEYLDTESAHLSNCTEEFVRHFSGRFQFLWGLYRAHSNAEDDIVFPALEAKEALHNVSHSYTIDHKQEEQLLKDISDVLQQLSILHTPPKESTSEESSTGAAVYREEDIAAQQQRLAGKLQRMCKSLRVSLDQHVSREELELWPLFDVHFTIEEQDKIVGQIIGTTGAEVLQAMLPWVTTALTEHEQTSMLDTWRQATRNTRFEKWLSAWWEDASSVNPQLSPPPGVNTPPSGSDESLQILADYLGNGGSTCGVSRISTSPSRISLEEKNESFHQALPSDNMDTVQVAPNDNGLPMDRQCVGNDSSTYKPGWRDIFRMNQKELEAAIRKVSKDSSLDPRRKAYLIQNLMTSRWIVAQQELSTNKEDLRKSGNLDPDLCPSFSDEAQGVFGCEHYKRNCKIRADCCGLLTPCRFCHDKVSDHSMDRHATKEMMCMKCLKVQPVAQHCSTVECNSFSMARYYCNICKFFNNDEREIYHCPFCNLCRVGKGLGQDCFHCMTCNACMSMTLTVHKCLEKGLESDCPICHEFLFTSNTPVKALPCNHFMHSACFRAYACSNYTCPICSKSIGDMTVFFGMIDALLAAEQLPVEYRNRSQEILCNDCERKGTASFHWLYHKCDFCGSYNTRTI